jgi:ParB family chromosome partitioning protein
LHPPQYKTVLPKNEFRRNVFPNPDNPQSLDNVSDQLADETESSKNVSPNLDKEQSKTVQQVFESLGLMNWLSFTTKRLPLLNLPEEILMALREGKLEYTKAQALARVKDEELRKQLLSLAIASDWSLSQIKEQIITNTPDDPSPTSKTPNQIPDRLKNITQRIKKRQLWKEPRKEKQLVNLINKLEVLLGDE